MSQGKPVKLTDRAYLIPSNIVTPTKKGIINKLVERMGNFLYVKEKDPESKIYNSFMPAQSQHDSLTALQLIDYAKRTPQLDLAIESLVELIMGTEININSDSDDVKKKCEDFAHNIDLYELMRTGLRDELITGDLVFEIVRNGGTIEKIVEIDPLALWDQDRDVYGNVKAYVLNTQDGQQKITVEKTIHFKFKQVGKEPWGRSMFHSLAISRTVGDRESRPMIEQIWAMEDAMTGTFINYAYPMMVINYPNADADQLEKEAQKIRDWKPGDKLVQSTSTPPTFEVIESENTVGRMGDYVKHIAEVLMMGTGFSYEIFLGNFTSRASSETTDSVTMKKVRAHQKYLANKLKSELFKPFLGMDDESFNKANLQISFESGHIKDMTVDDVKNRVGAGIWTKDEAREWDMENTGVDLFDDIGIEQDQEQKDQMMQQKMDGMTQNLDKVRSVYKRKEEILKSRYKRKQFY